MNAAAKTSCQLIEKTLRKHLATRGSVNFDRIAIGHDELCGCCNGGRLLPAACFQAQP